MQVLFPKIGAIFQNIYSIKTTADDSLYPIESLQNPFNNK